MFICKEAPRGYSGYLSRNITGQKEVGDIFKVLIENKTTATTKNPKPANQEYYIQQICPSKLKEK